MDRTIFDDEHEAFRASFRTWLDREVVPHYLEWEKAGIVPHDLFVEAGKHGFLGMAIPEEYGGGGVDDFRYNLVIGEEIQAARRERRRARDHPPQRHLHAVLPARTAPRSSARRWLPGIVSGELITAIAMTEPGIGSDLAGMSTSADPRRRRLRGERLEDVHHQRHQRRSRDHGGEDRPVATPRRACRCSSSSAAWTGSSAAATSRSSACTPRTPPSCSSPTCTSPPRTCSARRARASSTSCTTSPRSGCRSRSPPSPPPGPRSAGRSSTCRSARRSASRSGRSRTRGSCSPSSRPRSRSASRSSTGACSR